MVIKHPCINKVLKYFYFPPVLYTFLFVSKVIIEYLKTPGAQGGTGGW